MSRRLSIYLGKEIDTPNRKTLPSSRYPSAPLKLAQKHATPSTLHLNDERINTAHTMFAPSGQPLSTHAQRSKIYSLFIIYTSRAFPPCLFFEMDVCPSRSRVSRARSVMKTLVRA